MEGVPFTGVMPYPPPPHPPGSREGSMKLSVLILAILVLTIFLLSSPAAALDQTHLPQGHIYTSYLDFPNQMGLDNVSIGNLTEAQQVNLWNLSVGNVQYPPIYEVNFHIIPFEIWIGFLIIAIAFLTVSVTITARPDGQVILACIAALLSGYDWVTCSFIGFYDLASNPAVVTPNAQGINTTLMLNVLQPSYMVYAAPFMWVVGFGIFIISILAILMAGFNLIIESARVKGMR